MRLELEGDLEDLRAGLSADLLVVRQHVGTSTEGVVLLAMPADTLPAGTPWPRSPIPRGTVVREAAPLAAALPTSIRLALPRPPRAVLVVPIAGTTSELVAAWWSASPDERDAPRRCEASLALLGPRIAAWERQEAALLEARRHEQALSTLEEAVVTMDLLRETASVNAAAAQLLGLRRGQVPSHEVSEALQRLQDRATDRAVVRAVMMRLLTEPDAVIADAVWSFPSPPTHLRVSSAPIRQPGLSGRTWVFSDVSRLVDAVKEAERLERLKSEFIATVSHELRTPLTSIRGALGLMVGGITGPLPPLAAEHAGLALKNAERLIRLVSDLLDLEKLQSGSLHLRLQKALLAPLVEQAVQANRGYAAALRIELSLSGTLPHAQVLVDPDRFEQVLTNLISNAAKFSPQGGVVEVSAACTAGRARVAVRDHGPGVPADFEDRLFQRFAQADGSDRRAQGGTGLGLSITRGLVERMGGTIGHERPEGGGARFFVELPVEDLAHPA